MKFLFINGKKTENTVDWLSDYLPICLPDNTKKKSYYMKTKVNVTFDVYSKVCEDTDKNTFVKNYVETNINHSLYNNININCLTEKVNINALLMSRNLIKEEI